MYLKAKRTKIPLKIKIFFLRNQEISPSTNKPHLILYKFSLQQARVHLYTADPVLGSTKPLRFSHRFYVSTPDV